jgi:hypothetical protein
VDTSRAGNVGILISLSDDVSSISPSSLLSCFSDPLSIVFLYYFIIFFTVVANTFPPSLYPLVHSLPQPLLCPQRPI